MAYAGCVSGRNCCPECTIFDDNFNRTNSTDLGSGWEVITSEVITGTWEIQSNTLACMASPGIVRATAATPGLIIDDVGYLKSAKVSIKWLPIESSLPVTQRLHLGYIAPETNPDQVRYSIFLQTRTGTVDGQQSIFVRLGYVKNFDDYWLTDDLPIGWADADYTGEDTYTTGEKYFLLTLCWEPRSVYGTRDIMDVTGTITTYTGTHYTLEGTIYEPGLNTSKAILEHLEGLSRYDDLTWKVTKPDAPKCPWCGQCLFAADMTTADDQGVAAYSHSGGTFARNATTGALEATSTAASWLVDLPARHRLSVTYTANWSGASPSFTITDGPVVLAFSKVSGNQSVAVTVNGTSAGTITADIDNNTLEICFGAEEVLVQLGDGQNVYGTEANTGYVNLSISAGEVEITLQEITASRTDSKAVTRYGCEPCDLAPVPMCEVCPEAPFELVPLAAAVIEGNFSVVTGERLVWDYFGASCPAPWTQGDGVACSPLVWPYSTQVVRVNACNGLDDFPPAALAERIDDLDFGFGYSPLGGYESPPATGWWGPFTTRCAQLRFLSPVCNDLDNGLNMRAAHFIELNIYKGKAFSASSYSFFLEVVPYIMRTWSNSLPWPAAVGPRTIYECVGGTLQPVAVNDFTCTSPGQTYEQTVPIPIYASDIFDECDTRTTFTLNRIGAASKESKWETMTYPDTITVTLLR